MILNSSFFKMKFNSKIIIGIISFTLIALGIGILAYLVPHIESQKSKKENTKNSVEYLGDNNFKINNKIIKIETNPTEFIKINRTFFTNSFIVDKEINNFFNIYDIEASRVKISYKKIELKNKRNYFIY